MNYPIKLKIFQLKDKTENTYRTKPAILNNDQQNYYTDLFTKTFAQCLSFDYTEEVKSECVISSLGEQFWIKKLLSKPKQLFHNFSNDHCWQEFKNQYESLIANEIIKVKISTFSNSDSLDIWITLPLEKSYYAYIKLIRREPKQIGSDTFIDWDQLTDVKSVVLLPCQSEHQLNPRRKKVYPCKHILHLSHDSDCSKIFETFSYVDSSVIHLLKDKLPSVQLFRAPCLFSPHCLFRSLPLFSSITNQRSLTIFQPNFNVFNFELLVQQLLQKNIEAWSEITFPLKYGDKTLGCVFHKCMLFGCDYDMVHDGLLKDNLNFTCVRYSHGINRYLDVRVIGENSTIPKNLEDDWGIFIKMSVGKILIQLESYTTYLNKRIRDIFPFKDHNSFNTPQTIKILQCSSFYYNEKWGGERKKCQHRLYMIEQNSKTMRSHITHTSPSLTLDELVHLGLFNLSNIKWKIDKRLMICNDNCKLILFLNQNYPHVLPNVKKPIIKIII